MRSIFLMATLFASASMFMAGVAPVVVADDKAESGETISTDDAELDRRVCRRIQVTGSRVKERLCQTQRDWNRLSEESRETIDKAREKGNVAVGEG